MKKLILLPAILLFTFFASCDNEKKTDDSKPYGSTDTTSMQRANSAADSSHHQAGTSDSTHY